MPKILNFKGGEKSFENLKAVIDDGNLIAVICLGSSSNANQCYQDMRGVIGNQSNTVVTYVSDDADAKRVKDDIAGLNGPDPREATICVVVGHDRVVEGTVEPPNGSGQALSLWLGAVIRRGL
ncbi:MAG TPA: hypothetical protein PKA27_15995 [Fimbriimonadaceae bacterium]|nr:hypothetical protein [Fimbriimonadaceae bacterium]